MTIICEKCKTELTECPKCGGRLTSNLWISILALIIAFICLGGSVFRWQESLLQYDRAMKLRRKYLKKSTTKVPNTMFNRNQ